jgi:hypothetical protein
MRAVGILLICLVLMGAGLPAVAASSTPEIRAVESGAAAKSGEAPEATEPAAKPTSNPQDGPDSSQSEAVPAPSSPETGTRPSPSVNSESPDVPSNSLDSETEAEDLPDKATELQQTTEPRKPETAELGKPKSRKLAEPQKAPKPASDIPAAGRKAIEQRAAALGLVAVDDLRCGLAGDGCVRTYEPVRGEAKKFAIYWTPKTGAHAVDVDHPIYRVFKESNWGAGRYGYPVGAMKIYSDGSALQPYEKGTIKYSPPRIAAGKKALDAKQAPSISGQSADTTARLLVAGVPGTTRPNRAAVLRSTGSRDQRHGAFSAIIRSVRNLGRPATRAASCITPWPTCIATAPAPAARSSRQATWSTHQPRELR